MTIKEIFEHAENGTLTLEQFNELAKESKFVDLNEGNYYSKAKHAEELEVKDRQISTLNDTIKKRDTDLSELKTRLEEAGTDTAKLEEVNNQLSELRSTYEKDTKAYKEQLKKQSYEFAVREFAGTKEFSSQAAKRDFIQSMLAKDLKMEGNTILGADDFVAVYQETNADAFVKHEDPAPAPEQPLPTFGQPTPPTPPASDNAFIDAFHFSGVRAHE